MLFERCGGLRQQRHRSACKTQTQARQTFCRAGTHAEKQNKM